MKIEDLIGRGPPAPWRDAARIPWSDPDFSRRMLREHLSQHHDAASRRSDRIDCHVTWIDAEVLGGHAGRVLDLGCGPGLYTERLAACGHSCVGVDCGPASIQYARERSVASRSACEYRQGDLLDADLGSGYDAALLLFGEFNTFPRAEAERLVERAACALAPGGALVLELHPFEAVRAIGLRTPSWRVAETSVFADSPHLQLTDCAWDDVARATAQRFTVIDVATGMASEMHGSFQAWTDDELAAALEEAGLVDLRRHPGLGEPADASPDLDVVVARRGSG